MAIYDWPSNRTFTPQTAELRVIDNTQRALESPMSGYVQTLSMPGARWGWGFDFGAHADADRDALEAYLLRLSGREHRVRLWDLKRPRPRGSIQTAGVTLGAAAAQFATTLQLAGCRGTNALLGGSFESDANADGVADGWVRYTNGSTGAIASSLVTSGVALGAYQQQCVAAALGSAATDRNGVWQSGVPVALLAGQTVTLSGLMAGTAGSTLLVYAAWKNAGGSSVGADLFVTVAATGGVQTLYVSGLCPADAVTADVYAYQRAGFGESAVVLIDAVALQLGVLAGSAVSLYPAQPITLLSGDWLGLVNGQLVRVVADAVADDAGRMTVDVRHMLRSTVASGSAVTLDKPAALFVRTEAGLMLPRMPGLAAPPMSADFVEVFA